MHVDASPYDRRGATDSRAARSQGWPVRDSAQPDASTAISQLLLAFWALVVIFPFLWMIVTVVQDRPGDPLQPVELPAHCSGTTSRAPGPRRTSAASSSIRSIVLAGSLTGTLLVSSMAAYVLARFDFPGRQIIFYVFIAGLMFPVFLALVPLYFLVNDLIMLGHVPGADPGLHRLLAAVHDLLPDRLLQDAADRGGRGGASSTAPATTRSSSRSCCRWPSPG